MLCRRAAAFWHVAVPKRLEDVMNTLKQLIIATSVLAALASPGAAKLVSDQIWDNVNQTTPYKPVADEFKDAVPHRPGVDDYKDALPHRPGADATTARGSVDLRAGLRLLPRLVARDDANATPRP
jgi:hypothetical protein